MSAPDVTVRDNPAEHRFEIWVGDRRAGLTSYQREGSTYVYTHTETEPEFSGRGLATQLVETALDTMRERRAGVLPLCPFVLRYIKDHPGYADLVPSDDRPRLGLTPP